MAVMFSVIVSCGAAVAFMLADNDLLLSEVAALGVASSFRGAVGLVLFVIGAGESDCLLAVRGVELGGFVVALEVLVVVNTPLEALPPLLPLPPLPPPPPPPPPIVPLEQAFACATPSQQ
jgi:hypothetical protein